MFIEVGGTVKVELYVRNGQAGTCRVESNLEEVPEKNRDKYEKHVFTLRPLTWKQHNDIQRAATVNRGPGIGSDLDWVLYKERKLCTVLAGWDAKDKDGKDVPVNDSNIFKLNPHVAEALLQEFDKATIMGDDDRKN